MPFTLLFWVCVYTPFLCFLSREDSLAFFGKLVFVVLNSLIFSLSVKRLISPSYLNEILAGYSNLGCRLFSFITLSMSCHFLLAWRVSIERSALIFMGIPLCAICCFSLAAFNICALCLIFVNLINMCFGVFHLGFILFGTLWVSWTWVIDYFLPHFREVFNYYLKYFLMAFLFVFFFWNSYDLNVGAFYIIPEVSEVVLISFNSFLFFPLCFIYFHHSIFHLTYPQLFHCWFLPEGFWSQLLHYSLLTDSSLFLLGPC